MQAFRVLKRISQLICKQSDLQDPSCEIFRARSGTGSCGISHKHVRARSLSHGARSCKTDAQEVVDWALPDLVDGIVRKPPSGGVEAVRAELWAISRRYAMLSSLMGAGGRGAAGARADAR